MFLNTIVYDEKQYESVKRSISTYRENFKNYRSELERRVDDDEELNFFYSNIISESIKVSILDKISSDKLLQKKYSNDLIKFLNFYSGILSKETTFLKHNSDVENSINILHSNNDKLQNKLKDIYIQFETNFSKNDDYKFELDNIVITLPEGDNNEGNQVDRFNLSNRINIQFK